MTRQVIIWTAAVVLGLMGACFAIGLDQVDRALDDNSPGITTCLDDDPDCL